MTPTSLVRFTKLVPDGGFGQSNQDVISAAMRAVSPPRLTGVNAGFVRRHALLSTLLMTDLWHSNAQPAMVDVLRSVKGYRNINDVIVSTFHAQTTTQACGPYVVDDGGFQSLAAETGGIVSDACAMDDPKLYAMGRNIFGGDQREFRILGTASAAPLTVAVNGSTLPGVAWRWSDAGVVTLQPGFQPNAGDVIRIDYAATCGP